MAFLSQRLADQIQERTVRGAYGDRALCIVKTNGVQDAAGQFTVAETIIPLDCSWNEKPDRETWSDIDLQNISAEIRFDGPIPRKGMEFELVSVCGLVSINVGRRFEVVDIRDRGRDGFLVALKRVQK